MAGDNLSGVRVWTIASTAFAAAAAVLALLVFLETKKPQAPVSFDRFREINDDTDEDAGGPDTAETITVATFNSTREVQGQGSPQFSDPPVTLPIAPGNEALAVNHASYLRARSFQFGVRTSEHPLATCPWQSVSTGNGMKYWARVEAHFKGWDGADYVFDVYAWYWNSVDDTMQPHDDYQPKVIKFH